MGDGGYGNAGIYINCARISTRSPIYKDTIAKEGDEKECSLILADRTGRGDLQNIHKYVQIIENIGIFEWKKQQITLGVGEEG